MIIFVMWRKRAMSISFKFFLVFLFSVAAFFAANTYASDRLLDQKVVHEKLEKNLEYPLALSSLKNINAQMVAEKEILLRGDVHKQTFEIDSTKSDDLAWALIQGHVEQYTTQLLFSCLGLECGSSNAWANQRFNVRQLYGLDQSQRYEAYQIENTSNEFLAVYFVRQGNRRIYAQVDHIVSEGRDFEYVVSAKAIQSALDENGYYIVGESIRKKTPQYTEATVQAVYALIRQKPHLKFLLVGHFFGASNDENLQYGLQAAEKLLAGLEQKGANTQQVKAVSVGSYAPRAAYSKNRVELVLQR